MGAPQAKLSAAGQIAGAFIGQGLDNMSTTGQRMGAGGMGPPETVQGGFLSPVNSQGAKVSGFRNRLNYSGFLGGG